MRYFFHIGYNGYNYHGWQRHAPHLTVQEVLEVNLGKLLKEPITIIGCGRTDAQVHARQYFFHLDTDKLNDEAQFRLNKMLPEDIAVFDIIPVKEDAHAQYNAVQRTYDYFIHTCKDPFLSRFSCLYLEKNLDISTMKHALALLTKYNDYYSFCKSPEKQEHTICNVTSAKLFSDPQQSKLLIQISSNRFLRGMIRAIVARLIKTGSGQMSIDDFENHFISPLKDEVRTFGRTKEGQSNIEFAPPQGLYLSKVVYPFLDTPQRSQFSPFFHSNEENEWQLAG